MSARSRSGRRFCFAPRVQPLGECRRAVSVAGLQVRRVTEVFAADSD